jgi:biotin transport system substrate-specific component
MKERRMQFRNDQATFLAGVLWPQTTLLRDILLVLAGSWLIGITAQVEIPMWPVPVTGQTFGVLLVAALLGSRRGASAILAYLAQGAIGFPLFAGGSAGFAVLVGPTAGYLAGFVPAAFVVGYLCEQGWDRKVGTAVLAFLLGNIIIYLFGVPWLATFVGWDQVLTLGVIPFIPGDILKVLLTAVAMPVGWKLLR